MTLEQQRIAIAEACGAKRYERPFDQKVFLCWSQPYGSKPWRVTEEPITNLNNDIPNYLTDLNAMHEAEKVLDGNQQINFACYLTQPVRDEIYEVMPNDLRYTVCYPALHATASQRAEAFLRTLNLYIP